jgi:hypothetical protein
VARDRLTAAAALASMVLLTAAGCSTQPADTSAGSVAAQPHSAVPATGTAPAPPGPGIAAITEFSVAAADPANPVPTGTGWQPTVLGRAPGPPRLLAVPADFTSPQAVAAAYLQVWCDAPAGRPANSNLANTAPWMTAAGWADDTTRAVDDPTWARTQAAGVSTGCGPATAEISPQAPAAPDETWVIVSAQQARMAGGVLIGQGPVSMVRRVLRAPDGRWLVDVRVLAG